MVYFLAKAFVPLLALLAGAFFGIKVFQKKGIDTVRTFVYRWLGQVSFCLRCVPAVEFAFGHDDFFSSFPFSETSQRYARRYIGVIDSGKQQ